MNNAVRQPAGLPAEDEFSTVAAEAVVTSLIFNRPVDSVEVPPALLEFKALALRLEAMYKEQQEFARHLAAGELDAPPPPRTNYLAGGLKQLHAQMRHLTWQAQRVANGDYRQRVDFMGEFSAAFNNMVDLLAEREQYLKAQWEAMHLIYERLEAGIAVAADGVFLYRNEASKRQFPQHCPLLDRLFSLPPDGLEHVLADEESGRWYNVTACNIPWEGQDDARMYFCLDVTVGMQREEELKQALYTDGLTGITNRSGLNKQLATLWDECRRGGRPIALVMCDIDHFKQVNDAYGHQQGDACLQAFARVLKNSAMRPNDVVARYGGEEFIMVLPFTGRAGALKVAGNVRRAAENLRIPAGRPGAQNSKVQFTVSCGVAVAVPAPESSFAALVERADKALYAAKEAGRNRVVFHEEVRHEEA